VLQVLQERWDERRVEMISKRRGWCRPQALPCRRPPSGSSPRCVRWNGPAILLPVPISDHRADADSPPGAAAGEPARRRAQLFLLSVTSRGLIGVPQKPLSGSSVRVTDFCGFQRCVLGIAARSKTFCLWGAVSIVTAMTRRR
jgi:hypothetical protein